MLSKVIALIVGLLAVADATASGSCADFCFEEFNPQGFNRVQNGLRDKVAGKIADVAEQEARCNVACGTAADAECPTATQPSEDYRLAAWAGCAYSRGVAANTASANALTSCQATCVADFPKGWSPVGAYNLLQQTICNKACGSLNESMATKRFECYGLHHTAGFVAACSHMKAFKPLVPKNSCATYTCPSGFSALEARLAVGCAAQQCVPADGCCGPNAVCSAAACKGNDQFDPSLASKVCKGLECYSYECCKDNQIGRK